MKTGLLIATAVLTFMAGCSSPKTSVPISTNQAISPSPAVQPPISMPVAADSSAITVTSQPQQLAQNNDAPLVVVGQDGAFLGVVSNNQYDNQSICNQYGTHGSPYSAESLLNQYGQYGSRYSSMGAYNPNAQKPPIIVQNGQVMYLVTKNNNLQGSLIDPDALFLNVCGSINR